MNIKCRILSFMIACSIIAGSALTSNALTANTLDGEVSRSSESIYGDSEVTRTNIVTSSDSKYGQQVLNVIEYSASDTNIKFNVTNMPDSSQLATVPDQINNFNSTNTSDQVAIAATNGDLWGIDGHQVQVGTNVKSGLYIPRGYNVVDGEIVYSKNNASESEVNGSSPDQSYCSFGIAADGTPMLGCIRTMVHATDTTISTRVTTIGINRLPADNSVVLYTDKGPSDNECMDDSYEVYIDCSYDYKMAPDCNITGTVTGISTSGNDRQSMKANRIILTGRGDSVQVEALKKYAIGDSVTIDCSIFVQNSIGTLAKWKTAVMAVGGQKYIVNGGSANSALTETRSDPMTVIGITSDNKIVMITDDGRQTGYSTGMVWNMWDDLCSDLGISSAVMLDGGGSTTMAERTGTSYTVVNKVSDTDSSGNPGVLRAVSNAVVISYTCEHDWSKTLTVHSTFTSHGYYTMTCSKCSITKTQSIPYLGDLNNDGYINAKDLLVFRKYLAGLTGSVDNDAADCDIDGTVSVSDLLMIRKHMVGLI